MLSLDREALVELSAALASRSAPALERALRFADRLAPAQEVREVLLQAHLFVGFPIVLEAMMLWRKISSAPPPAETAPEGEEVWTERGEKVCRAVYGENYEKLRRNVRALDPDLDRWMVVGGYGRVIGRGGLDLATRELCIAALLAVWKSPRQLHSHLRGALNAGADPDEVAAAVEIACRYLDPGAAIELRAFWGRVAGVTGVRT
jgi:4-carboxymuconolactone decarboxylase